KEFHEAADFEENGKFIEGAPHYYLQCFTDRDTVPFGNLHAPSKDDLTKYAAIAGKYVKHVGIRGVD
ncbi:MAG: anaerobic ribonucleoside-triphosphate reductase activating protein, partial [Lachnospiraceae bacterium]|nr:anaerobic ribonucleoside-triphosphate reductase activating protein [Lachnospiraceae bacterium]